ncbi:Mss4-like protein [Lactarius pseudohatsudake]|nr:Mss4-like protein [Lactarius pseudohatsudake]
MRIGSDRSEGNSKHDHTVSSRPLTGACFCDAVTYELSAPPMLRAYCHCTQCQRLTGVLSMHPYCTIHFPASAFAWTHDSPVDSFVNPLKPWKTRTRCRAWVSPSRPHLARDHSGHILRWAELRPTAHIFYDAWEGYEGTSEKIA